MSSWSLIGDDKVVEYINSQYRPADKQLAALREWNESNEVPLILRETEGLLSLLLELHRPSRILEIGAAYGYSALFFARSLPHARVTTIERSSRMIEEARKCFANNDGGERITLLTGDASEILDRMTAEEDQSDREGFDFVFIDAGKSHYRSFFDKAEKLCSPGALVVCDNILMHGWLVDRTCDGAKRHRTNVKYMRSFIDYIIERKDLTVSLISSGDGLAIIKLNERNEQ